MAIKTNQFETNLCFDFEMKFPDVRTLGKLAHVVVAMPGASEAVTCALLLRIVTLACASLAIVRLALPLLTSNK